MNKGIETSRIEENNSSFTDFSSCLFSSMDACNHFRNTMSSIWLERHLLICKKISFNKLAILPFFSDCNVRYRTFLGSSMPLILANKKQINRYRKASVTLQ